MSAFHNLKLCRIDQLRAWSMNQIPFYAGIPFLVIGLIGNLFVIRIVHKIPEMHTPTNYLLVSMAVSDLVTILLWPVYYLEFAKFVCKFVALAEVSIMVSFNTLTVLAVERYHAILKPFATGLRLNKDNIKRAITCIWIATFVTGFPEFFLKEWSETNSTWKWSERTEDFLDVADFFFVSSLSLNPIIYGFRGKKFREGLTRMLLCWKPTTQNNAFELNN